MSILERFKNIIKFDRLTVTKKTESATTVVTPDLSHLKLAELRAVAKDRGLKGYTQLRKAALLDLLSE